MLKIFITQDKIIDLLNDNAKIRSEAIYKSKKKMKLREKDLKYWHLNKCFKDYQ